MIQAKLNSLEFREVFHLEFLRRLSGKLDPKLYCLKGGGNLRFYFGSARYSEDLDVDVADCSVARLKEIVSGILKSSSLADSLSTFGIHEIRPLDMTVAKQNETTQRFKVHLLTAAGEDLFTKVEFSRRGFDRGVDVEFIPLSVLRRYGLSPLILPHYSLSGAIGQKIRALASRTTVQARDIFDLHVLLARSGVEKAAAALTGGSFLSLTRERLYEVEFDVFRDTVLSYLALDDRKPFDRPEAWDALRLQVAEFLESVEARHG